MTFVSASVKQRPFPGRQPPPITSWKGKRFDKMTRAELVAALQHAARLYQDCYYIHRLRNQADGPRE